MKTISLAIPFYNTSNYFLDCIKYSLDNDFVSEIVVNDDCSSKNEWDKLNQIINTLNVSKIKVFRNEENLGPFRNKYRTVNMCSNQWIYLLDSDNHPFENSYSLIGSVSDENPLIVYSPQHLYCKNDNVENYETISNYDFKYDSIGIEETKDMIFKRTKWFDWFFNSGNYIINRNTYLEALKDPYQDKGTVLLDADTASSFYFLLKYGVKFEIIKGLAHHHRLRKDSTWVACGEKSQMSVDYYKNLSTNL
jgi:glycosyltransferase involved in cell wall biosynthesis